MRPPADGVTPPPPEPQIVPVTTPTIEPPLITLTEDAAARTRSPLPSLRTPPPPAPAPPAPRVITDVAYVEAPQPRYPPESKRSGEEGLVVLRVLINELGRAARVEVERSSGHLRLDEAARLAVQRALFRPYVENGVARMALATIPIEFIWKSRRADKSAEPRLILMPRLRPELAGYPLRVNVARWQRRRDRVPLQASKKTGAAHALARTARGKLAPGAHRPRSRRQPTSPSPRTILKSRISRSSSCRPAARRSARIASRSAGARS